MTDQSIPTVALIDVAGIFRARWAISENQPQSDALSKTVELVRSFRAQYDYCAICVDSPPYRRNQLCSTYKAQRARASATMLEYYARTKQRLADDGLPVFAVDGYEADDIVATLAKALAVRPSERRVAVTVVSADKDLMQLVNDAARINYFNWSTGQSFSEDTVCEAFKVSPAGIRDLLALAGDSTDNVDGVKGVGRITAAIIVNSGPGLEGALAGEFIKGVTPSCAERIAEAREAVLLARKLVTLETDAPVSADEIFVKREPKRASEPPPAPRAKPVASAPQPAFTSQIVSRTAEPATALTRAEVDWGMGVPVDLVVARVEKVREIQSRIMKQDHHFGVVPGTGGKPTLLKPGAELLTLTFQLAPQFSLNEQRDGDHLESVVTCTLTHAPTGILVGSGIGSCSTRESKYAWRKGERRCPKCAQTAIIKGRDEYGGGWVCFHKKGGCGAKFEDRDRTITSQSVERVANIDIPDSYNTVRKMACKRAHVAAILVVTCASEIFTQDAEDNADGGAADYADQWQAPPRDAQRHRGAA